MGEKVWSRVEEKSGKLDPGVLKKYNFPSQLLFGQLYDEQRGLDT